MTRSAAIRERLKHPVVDVDGHITEFLPLTLEFMRNIGGAKLVERYLARFPTGLGPFDGDPKRAGAAGDWHALSQSQRRERRVTRPGFWGLPTDPLDRATVTLPDLFRKRIDDFGIDFAITYPTAGFNFTTIADEDIRRVACRAVNTMNAELFRPHADRMTPAAVIPMFNPAEALEELEYAVQTLNMKVAMLGTCIRRPIAEVTRVAPEVAAYATWIDVIAHDSEFDYDPVWQKCVDLRVAVTAHSSGVGFGTRTSTQNFVYNHVGHFAAAGEAFCKALVLGGVVQRFPSLPFAFLEGGVGWACSLYNDLIEHWKTRNVSSMRKHLDPDKLEASKLAPLFDRYGGTHFKGRLTNVEDTSATTLNWPVPVNENSSDLDDWTALEINEPHVFAKIFTRFFFGCEPGDRMVAAAFLSKLNHFDARLQAMFSSDIGHFDIADITSTLAEAYELVDDGLVSEDDFRDFTFTNAVRLHSSLNPDFFSGTAVETAARDAMLHGAGARGR